MLIRTDDVEPQPWRNGGGQTRELVVWPTADDWRFRVSVADIDANGPFSVFDGVTRWMTVIAGAGVRLRFADSDHRLVVGDSPIHFDGATAPHCELINGATRDLNLMTRGGQGMMEAVEAGTPWDDDFEMRGLFTTEPGRWSDGVDTRSVPAMSLLWSDATDGRNWTFTHDEPRSSASAWWMGFTA